MLTRLQIDGFKNLVGVEVEFGPFTCVAGPNGIGKSNLFDAIRFLSLLAEFKLLEAARRVRGGEDDPSDPRDLFTRLPGHDEPSMPMRLAVEAILPQSVRDSFGREASPSISFVRYELELAYLAPQKSERYGHLKIRRESLRHINLGDAPKHISWKHSARDFRSEVITGRRSGGAFISTTDDAGEVVIQTHQDGGSRGKPRKAPAATAIATVVGATNTVDDPTIFAVKQEMLGWRHLALEPSAMRRADKYWDVTDGSSIAENGARIPSTLWSLADDDETRRALMRHVALTLSELVSVEDVRVRANDANQQFELEVRESGVWSSARSLSEGTLRFLALIAVAEDPDSARLICMEEPENGIHPERLPAMLKLLDSIAVDPTFAPGPDNPVRQVLVNTHSPRLVQILEANGRRDDLLVAEAATSRFGEAVVKTVRFRHRSGSWREKHGGAGVGPGVAVSYLTVPAGAQVSLLVADGS